MASSQQTPARVCIAGLHCQALRNTDTFLWQSMVTSSTYLIVTLHKATIMGKEEYMDFPL